MPNNNSEPLTYDEAGVTAANETSGMKDLLGFVKKTFSIRPTSLELGYFASVIDIGDGKGIAISTDGVGTKILVAEACEKYDTIGIDCIAMNANDIICVGARPLSLVDYIAVQTMDGTLLGELGKGLYEGAAQARINIPGGEIAQLSEMVTGLHPGSGFDLVGTCVGTVDLDKIIVGQDLEPGDIIVGIASSGLHSNGFTLARRVLFEKMGLDVTSRQTGLDRTVGEDLLEPTNIYVPEAMELLEAGVKIKSFAHITGDGLLNLTRTKAKVGFRITDLPDIPPIFTVIAEGGPVTPGEMWSVFNMGIGFCVIVDADDLSKTLEITGRRYNSQLIGHVTNDPRQRVHIEPYKLVGSPKTPFCAE